MTTEDAAHKLERFTDAVFVATNLEHDRLQIERELQDIKWVGYRFMTPLAATRLFYDTYRQLRIGYIREHQDVNLARTIPEVPFERFAADPEALALAWSSRQVADTFGAPYDLYIAFGMWFWSRRSWGGRSKTPQINQMRYNDTSEAIWRAEYQKYLNEHLYLACRSLADVPQLHPAAFVGNAEQIAARKFLLEMCVSSARPWHGLIEMWCQSYPVLTPECFASVVPEDVLRAAMETAGHVPRDPLLKPDPLPAGSLWPSCHGMPGAHDATSTICKTCDFAESCVKFSELVTKEVRRRNGHEQPRKAQLRAPANARQARYRERQKEKKRELAKGAVSSSAHIGSSLPEDGLP